MAAEEREKISCVGTPTGNVRVYLEENCAEYLREKTASELGDFQMFGLLGREYRLGDQIIFLIRGILENRGNGTRQMQISLETIRAMETEKERQFPSLRRVGWAVNQPGYGTEGAWRFAEMGEKYFADAALFLLMDGSRSDMAFYYREDGEYRDLGGYHIYSDEEEAGRGRSVSERLWDDDGEDAAEPLWKPEEKRTEETAGEAAEPEAELPAKEGGPSLRMLTSLASVLLLVCLVMGMLLFNNINTLDGIRSKLDVLDQQIEQIHTGMFGTE